MDRRSFLEATAFGAGGYFLSGYRPRTQHLIFIVNGAARKKDYYENESLARNIRRLAGEGFVLEEEHCDRIVSHDAAFAELLSMLNSTYRTCSSLHRIPEIMEAHKPRVLVYRETANDVGHESYEKYLQVVKATDLGVGKIYDWVRNHPYFGNNTAIVIRPEFGRDDEVNHDGQLHHSEGFYYTHRVASIFWGPDFRKGIDRTVINRYDLGLSVAGGAGGGGSITSSAFTLNRS